VPKGEEAADARLFPFGIEKKKTKKKNKKKRVQRKTGSHARPRLPTTLKHSTPH
jgi:hypothetical protein